MSHRVEYIGATQAGVGDAARQVETEAERVFEWRRSRLVAAGFDPRLAFKLALQSDVDLHAASTLLERGCDPDTAARILL